MAQIFLSYSRRDQDSVKKLISQIKAAGHSVWLDRADLRSGAHWQAQIVKAIEEADVFIITLSQNSIGSEHVLTELNLAKDGKLPIIPVVIEHSMIPASMRYQLAGLQLTDLATNLNLGLKALLLALDQYKNAPKLASSHYNVRLIAGWLKRIQEDGGDDNWVTFHANKQKGIFITVSGYINNPTLRARASFFESQIATIKSLGWWVSPDMHLRDDHEHDWEARSDSERLLIAQHIMRTFVEAYGIHPDAPIEVDYQLERVAPGVARLEPID